MTHHLQQFDCNYFVSYSLSWLLIHKLPHNKNMYIRQQGKCSADRRHTVTNNQNDTVTNTNGLNSKVGNLSPLNCVVFHSPDSCFSRVRQAVERFSLLQICRVPELIIQGKRKALVANIRHTRTEQVTWTKYERKITTARKYVTECEGQKRVWGLRGVLAC